MWTTMLTSRMKAVLVWAAVTVLVCAAVGVWSYRTGHASGAAKVQASWDAEKAATAKAHAQQLIRARDAQIALSTQIDQQRREADREKARILADHRAALDRLRDRPERPSTPAVPDAAGVATPARGCTGAELYREDAVAALGIGRDADLVVAALHECRAGYKAAKDRLDALNRTATQQPAK